MLKPETRYTKSGRINIAYQVFGEGPIDIVYIPGWVSNIDLMWNCRELVDFFYELGTFARVILFDKRGTGLSDRISELSTLEERMDDIRAVMDACNSKQAVLFGHSEGGSVSALFSATYPDRTHALIAFGIFAKRRYSEDYPWAPTDLERQKVYDMIETSWGSGNMDLVSLAPSKGDDKVFMNWLANYFRSGASPSAALALTKMNTQVDIVDVLPSIKVPTLLLQRTGDIDVKIEEGRFIARKIPNAKLIEFEGEDHLFWAGDSDEVLTEMKQFIKEIRPSQKSEERLYTIICIEFEAEIFSPSIQDLVQSELKKYKGSLIKLSRKNLYAFFEGPSKSAHCSISLVEKLKKEGINSRIVIDLREILVKGEIEIYQKTETYFSNLLNLAPYGRVLITQAIKHLINGSGLTIITYKHESEFLQSPLYTVTDTIVPEHHYTENKSFVSSDSFLEDVIKIIEQNISCESFGVQEISQQMGLGSRQLQRKLKEISNKSPNQLITSVRLHKAKEMMIDDPNFHISEIAHLCGFSSSSYFAKKFKNEFDVTPTYFREHL